MNDVEPLVPRYRVIEPKSYSDSEQFTCIIHLFIEAKYASKGQPISVLLHVALKDTYQECKDWAIKTVEDDPNEWRRDKHTLNLLHNAIKPEYRKQLMSRS